MTGATWLDRVRRKDGPLLPVADALMRRRWFRAGVLVMRADKLLHRLGLV